ncbi:MULTISPECIES: hypothetical protein [unclassified Rhizobacter]|uniref:hypothetical protein n=1 Tax=unclassified Rhizobacter TaxID=2640088 RepID=UPI0006F7B1C6|nr:MULTISPECIES: hypothetical protein [unclassified Rhizobacter]KQU80262.1 hypothetical protein ASC88_16640 [Rhizobacter sp. Root29]KQW13758.1 hypothetical protein ASC98_16770 [Rhizobacter sp. Root1238]KRB12448.1 hypothetical protein ASE08_28630 [Rhizobacter sp. Root16D2]
MNAIAPMESLHAAPTTTRAGQLHIQSLPTSFDPFSGGFPDAAAAQRQADRAAAARLTYEARLSRERREQARTTRVAAFAREEGRAEAAAQIDAQRRAGFWSGWRWGLVCGFPVSGLFFIAVISAGAQWKGLA